MEPSSLPGLPGVPSSPGDVVVQNGRLAGRRFPLAAALTLVGQAGDVPINGEGVEAVHCAIVAGADGPILIDRTSRAGTWVNGQRVSEQKLANDDVIEIAGVRMVVTLATPRTDAHLPTADVVATEQQLEALRIQAAAVAAQQAALFEDETKLEQRGTTLSRQEEQIATHLEARQQQLDQQEADTQARRLALEVEADEARRALEDERQQARRERAEAVAERAGLGEQRRQLSELRRRLRRRWKRQVAAREAQVARREAELAGEIERLRRERAQVKAFQERVNGELELGRRELRDREQELALEQQRWHETIASERAEQQRSAAELQSLATRTDAARRALEQERREAEAKLARLTREAAGVEARVLHARAQMPSPEVAGPAEPIIPPPAHEPAEPLPAQLVVAIDELMDQRVRLTEQWERLLGVQQAWTEDHAAALAALEEEAASLERREQQVRRAEQQAAAERAALAQRREAIEAARGAVEGDRARQASELAEWSARREGLLAEVEGRERMLSLHSEQLEESRRRWLVRQDEEAARLAEDRSVPEEARRQYSGLWQECERLREALAKQERALSGRALALERARQEMIREAPDAVRAEVRLGKLERQEVAQADREARQIEEQWRKLLVERQRLDALADALKRREEELAQKLRQFEQVSADREADAHATAEAEAKREQELRRLRAGRAIDERQLRQLRDELERLARALIEEDEPRREAA